MKLFQIEEPDGSPAETGAPGAAVGIDAGGERAEVAFAVGGNAVLLGDREGFALDLAVPSPGAPVEAWRHLFEGARMRAERALARPVSHAVLVLRWEPETELAARLHEAASLAGIALLRFLARGDVAARESPVLAAAVLAEDLAPPPEAV